MTAEDPLLPDGTPITTTFNMSTSLSVGQISTVIAAAVFVGGLFLRNVFPLLIMSSMKPESNAVTWGLLQRLLGGADLPFILQTDSTSHQTVDRRIRFLNAAFLFSTILLAVAAVATPAGLYEVISIATQPTMTQFQTAPDLSPFGLGPTKETNTIPWRECRYYLDGDRDLNYHPNCPGNSQQYNITVNETGVTESRYAEDLYVDRSRVEIFHSGLADMKQTVSSFFDIQARVVRRRTSNWYAEFGRAMDVDAYFNFERTVREDRQFLIDGLVVDARNGGIGFRQHTVPVNVPLGTEWEEDLTFLELETACVDMDLAIEFEIPYATENSSYGDQLYSFVDEGAFANFEPGKEPQYLSYGQSGVDLQHRAETYAWWGKNWLMRLPNLNFTESADEPLHPERSFVGRRFNVTDHSNPWPAATGISSIAYIFSLMLEMETIGNPQINSSQPDLFSTDGTNTQVLDSWQGCTGQNTSIPVSIDNFPLNCGYVFGASIPTNGPIRTFPEAGTLMRRKMYSCASATKASVKVVRFAYNETSEGLLEGLTVLSINDSDYSNKKEPLWGVETPQPLEPLGIRQLWGFLSEEYSNVPNITTSRSPYLYPPYSCSDFIITTGPVGSGAYESLNSYLPANAGLAFAIDATFHVASSYDAGDLSRDWTGEQDLALIRRWRILSENASTVSNLTNLVWTNVASNYFKGSRGWHNGHNIIPTPFYNETNPPLSAEVPTYQAERRIQYKLPYAIPAFVLCFILLLLVPVLCWITFMGGIKDAKKCLSMLSAGRLLVDASGDNESSLQIPYKRWATADTLGLTKFRVSGWRWQRVNDNTKGLAADPGSVGLKSSFMSSESRLKVPEGLRADGRQSPDEYSRSTSSVVETLQDARRPFLRDSQWSPG